ncbi:MAG: DUF2497 domain-containing protein [Parasphingopyxis sp.]|uniref:DUF2497 domain-containing protein n=1 Tax=Parasphingopyxis sp. TaxID=1920299 RepID=UPI003F9EFC5B
MGDVNHEPTMEEILASIKKIIAEDGETAVSGPDARSRRERPKPAEPAASDDVLELTEQVEQPEPADEAADPIMSDDTVAASQAALAALSAIANPANQGGNTDSAHPLEGLVREMLRPMLREWLDENLPAMVKEMVAREIARIAAHRG